MGLHGVGRAVRRARRYRRSVRFVQREAARVRAGERHAADRRVAVSAALDRERLRFGLVITVGLRGERRRGQGQRIGRRNVGVSRLGDIAASHVVCHRDRFDRHAVVHRDRAGIQRAARRRRTAVRRVVDRRAVRRAGDRHLLRADILARNRREGRRGGGGPFRPQGGQGDVAGAAGQGCPCRIHFIRWPASARRGDLPSVKVVFGIGRRRKRAGAFEVVGLGIASRERALARIIRDRVLDRLP